MATILRLGVLSKCVGTGLLSTRFKRLFTKAPEENGLQWHSFLAFAGLKNNCNIVACIKAEYYRR